MIVILEGIDKTGKSTLARKLVKELDGYYVKFSQPNGDPYQEYMGFLRSAKKHVNYVLDRFCYGELVYGPMYRNESGITVDQLNFIELLMMQFNPIVVYCETSKETISRNFQDQDEEFTDSEDIEHIIKLYKNVWNESILDPINFDYQKDHDHLLVMSDIKTNFGDFPIKKKIVSTKTYLGNPQPDYLFVGEEKNPNLKDNSVFESSSGKFLIEALKHTWSLDSCGFVNSFDAKRGPLTTRDIKYINPKKTIALGNVAADRVQTDFKINHPQYAKRFYGKDAMGKYINELEAVIDD